MGLNGMRAALAVAAALSAAGPAAALSINTVAPTRVVDATPGARPTDVFLHEGRRIFTGFIEDPEDGRRTAAVWAETGAGSGTFRRQTFPEFDSAEAVTGVSDVDGNASVLIVADGTGWRDRSYAYSNVGDGGSFVRTIAYDRLGPTITPEDLEAYIRTGLLANGQDLEAPIFFTGHDLAENLTIVSTHNPGDFYVNRLGEPTAFFPETLLFLGGIPEVISPNGEIAVMNSIDSGSPFAIFDISGERAVLMKRGAGVAFADATDSLFVGLASSRNPTAIRCTLTCGAFTEIDRTDAYFAAEFLAVQQYGAEDAIGLIRAFDHSFDTDYFAVQLSALPDDLAGAVPLPELSGLDVRGFTLEQTGPDAFALTAAVAGSVLGVGYAGTATPGTFAPVPLAPAHAFYAVGLLALWRLGRSGRGVPRA